ncbi:hypothetical protein K501DRAFT_283016 [Backusella circina FSU 941]|nr:hypothetical protein K501DRAFT_283016 [Backusella circina FSU 941]
MELLNNTTYPVDKKTKKAQIKSGTVLGIADKCKQNRVDHPPTPPESPITTTTKKSVTPNMFRFDMIAAELIEMYSTLIEHNQASDAYIERLQSDVEKYASDVTKVRDYEIRVEYLAQKLEQLAEERDQLEDELMTLHKQGPPPAVMSPLSPTITNPLSPIVTPAFTQFFQQQQQPDMPIERTEKQNDEFMADFLNVYEEIPPEQESLFDDDQQQQEDERLAERGVQITIAKYVTDLETQRLEVKRLKQVVQKQDELISKLEVNLTSDSDTLLLREQVDLQKMELENKRQLLAQLVKEREELLYRLKRYSNRTSSIGGERPSSLVSISSRSSSLRGSLPPTAPPRQPLPPLPDSMLG